jgi:two-component system cell cycle response regulator DivK
VPGASLTSKISRALVPDTMTKILLIEDNEMNRDMLSRRLSMRGFDVIVAIDGTSGAAAATTEQPDLILMDVSLPDMDGFEVTRLLRSQPGTASIPVIALTAHTMETDRLRAVEAGCQDYDTKPVDLTRLLAKINAVLSPTL